MTEPRGNGPVWIVAAAGFVAGPLTAALHESGTLSFGPDVTLWPIGFIVVAAAAGLATGVRLAKYAARPVGLVVALPNLLVLAVYGFLLLFFGMGGSR